MCGICIHDIRFSEKPSASDLVMPFVVQYIPITAILLITGIAAALGRFDTLPFLYFGAYSAWLYLRYFQQQQDSTAVVSLPQISDA